MAGETPSIDTIGSLVRLQLQCPASLLLQTGGEETAKERVELGVQSGSTR